MIKNNIVTYIHNVNIKFEITQNNAKEKRRNAKMKNKGVTILSIITNIILIAILCSFIKINGSIIKEKQIVKEMSESTQVTDLNNQINALNAEHTEYMKYIQTCKAQLASAITEMGVETSEDASVDTMASNIRNILEVSGANKEQRIKIRTNYTIGSNDYTWYSVNTYISYDDGQTWERIIYFYDGLHNNRTVDSNTIVL